MYWKNANRDWRMLTLSVVACWVLALSVASAQYTFGAKDADGKNVTLNPAGQTTLILIGNDDHEDDLREAARVVDDIRGNPKFRLYVVVDLRDSLGGIAPNLVYSQMKENMDAEQPQLRELYKLHGNKNNPRKDMATFADFNGQIVDLLGWKDETEDYLRAVLYDKNGRVVQRWNALKKKDYPQMGAKARTEVGGSPVRAAKAVPANP